jgi:hypothetical protein
LRPGTGSSSSVHRTWPANASDAGLLDELGIDLVPAVLGRGVRLFPDPAEPMLLRDPTVIAGDGVTHL